MRNAARQDRAGAIRTYRVVIIIGGATTRQSAGPAAPARTVTRNALASYLLSPRPFDDGPMGLQWKVVFIGEAAAATGHAESAGNVSGPIIVWRPQTARQTGRMT